MRVNAEVEDIVLEKPAVGDDAVAVLPELRLPQGLPADVLETPPRKVPDVVRRFLAAKRPDVLHEPLHVSQVAWACVWTCLDQPVPEGGHRPAR